MQPDSLVFLAIVAMWGAYFVQYWVRRREHLATARSVDEFTETMRVLRHRPSLPTTDLQAAPRSSYAVSLTRSARPQVTVKRADTSRADTSRRFEAETPVDPRGITSNGQQGEGQQGEGQQGEGQQGEGRSVHLVRSGLLAVAALSVVAVIALAALGYLGWVWVAAPVVALGLTLAWLRRSAQVSAAARVRFAERERRTAVASASGAVASDFAAVDTAPKFRATVMEPVASEPAAAAPAAAPAPDPAAAAAPDPEPDPTPEVEYVIEHKVLVDDDDIPLTWEPAAVPRPVYAMKAKATRRAVVPAEVTPTPAPEARGTRDRQDRDRLDEQDQPSRSAHTA